ncbi:MAG: AraC family transcriptional regulator [Eubacteriales bacterium]
MSNKNMLNINTPPFPYFVTAGKALYRAGDMHGMRPVGINLFDMILVTQGTLYVHVGNTQHTLSAGSMLIIPPHTKHHGAKICAETTEFHWLHFKTANEYILASKPETRLVDYRKRTDSVVEEVLSIPLIQKFSKEMTDMLVKLMSPLEYMTINRFVRATHRIQPTTNPFQQQELLMKIFQIICVTPEQKLMSNICFTLMQYIELNYNEKIDLDNLASAGNCHPTHVIRCIKKQYHMTPVQLITSVRLQHACELLLNSTHSVTDISYMVGFSSPSYFAKQFRKFYLITPNQYRLEGGNDLADL